MLRLEQSQRFGALDSFRATVDPKLCVHAFDVSFDGVDRQVKLGPDLSVRQSSAQQAEYLQFALAQLLELLVYVDNYLSAASGETCRHHLVEIAGVPHMAAPRPTLFEGGEQWANFAFGTRQGV